MLTFLLFSALIAFSVFQIMRYILILSGRWKGPILKLYEHYAPAESVFDPLPQLLCWVGTLIMSVGLLLGLTFHIEAPFYLIGVLLLLIAYAVFQYRPAWSHGSLLKMPEWDRALREITTREERRHIAYMWLRLPTRARGHLNDHDAAFWQWTELVILSTIQQTTYDQRVEEAGQRHVIRERSV